MFLREQGRGPSESSHESPLEGNGFKPSIPRCARTADSVAVV